jgi:hypothetical protein
MPDDEAVRVFVEFQQESVAKKGGSILMIIL